MRPPKPDILVQWEKWVEEGPPKMCHSCDHFGGEGQCYVYHMKPPLEFINEPGSCDSWSRECPF